MKKRWRNAGLYVLLAIVVIAVGTAFLDRPDPANAPRTLRYSDFVEAVQENQVSRVLISPDRGTAQVVENDGSRAVVNLAPDKDLLKLLDRSQRRHRRSAQPRAGRLAAGRRQPDLPAAAARRSVLPAAPCPGRWRQPRHELRQEQGPGADGAPDPGHLR